MVFRSHLPPRTDLAVIEFDGVGIIISGRKLDRMSGMIKSMHAAISLGGCKIDECDLMNSDRCLAAHDRRYRLAGASISSHK